MQNEYHVKDILDAIYNLGKEFAEFRGSTTTQFVYLKDTLVAKVNLQEQEIKQLRNDMSLTIAELAASVRTAKLIGGFIIGIVLVFEIAWNVFKG